MSNENANPGPAQAASNGLLFSRASIVSAVSSLSAESNSAPSTLSEEQILAATEQAILHQSPTNGPQDDLDPAASSSDAPAVSLADAPSHGSHSPAPSPSSSIAAIPIPATVSPWRPFSLRWPYLTMMTVISILLLTAIETLRQVSNRRNGIWHLTDPDITKFSTGITVVYVYVPTILGIVYSILWSYVDSDLKRVEPYVQMRESESPASLLFLDYIYKSAVTTPITSLKRRHWFVAICSSSYLLISLVLPASQGALFGVDRVTITTETMMTVSHDGLVMGPLVSGEYVDNARAIALPDGSNLPSWITNNYAVIPFWPQASTISQNETWTARSTVFYAQPKCRRYTVEEKSVFTHAFGYGFEPLQEASQATQILVLWNVSLPDSSPSCNLSISTTVTIWDPSSDHDNYVFAIHTKGFTFQGLSDGMASAVTEVQVEVPANGSQAYDVLSYNTDQWSNIIWRSATDTCPEMNYLAGLIELDTSRLESHANMWDASTLDANMILYDCDSDYYQAQATVTARGDNATVLSVQGLEDENELTEAQFGHTDFGAMLETGSTTFIGELDVVNSSRPNVRDIEHAASIARVVLANMTTDPLDLSFFQSVMPNDAVAEAFETAYKLVFALTLRGTIRSPLQARMAPFQRSGTITIETFAVIVVPEFAILSEALLVVGIISLLIFLFAYRRRKTLLCSDPDSISAQCSMISDVFVSPGVLASSLHHFDLLKTEGLRAEVLGSHLEYDETNHSISVVTPEQEMTAIDAPNAVMQGDLESDPLPKVMRKTGILASASLLFVLLAVMIWLLVWVRSIGGFSYLADSSTTRSQFLYSFMPTIFATGLETFWVSVHRDLGLLETWAAMRHGYTRAEQCLSLRYSSRPPSLVFFLSLRRRHFLLAFVSLLCLSTSVLSVVMAGLFLSSYGNFDFTLTTFPRYGQSTLPGFWWDEYDINQAFSVVRSSYSGEGELPSWTDTNRTFIPMDYTSLHESFSDRSGNTIRATTDAITSSLGCVSLVYDFTDNPNGPGVFVDANEQLTIRYSPSLEYAANNLTCAVALDWSLFKVGIFLKSLQPLDVSTDSTVLTSLQPDCPILVVSVTMTQNASMEVYGSEVYVCRPDVRIDRYEVETDVHGKVLSANLSDSEFDSPNILRNETELLAGYIRKYLGVTLYSYKEMENTTYDWPGLLMTRLRDANNITSISMLADHVWRTTFATWFSLYRDELLAARNGTHNGSDSEGEMISREARMVPVVAAFVIAIVLLAAYLATYLFVVLQRRHRYTGPRLPMTIGSIIPWVLHSRMLDDFAGTHSMRSRERDAQLKRMDHRYAFGRFRGKHGKVTLGIEYEELLLARGALGDY